MKTREQWNRQLLARIDELRCWRGLSEEEMLDRAGVSLWRFRRFATNMAKARITMIDVFGFCEALRVSLAALIQPPKTKVRAADVRNVRHSRKPR